MGYGFREPDKFNETGYYEDRYFDDLFQGMIEYDGLVPRMVDHNARNRDIDAGLKGLIETRIWDYTTHRQRPAIGFKSNSFGLVFPVFNTIYAPFGPLNIVTVSRPVEQIVLSHRRMLVEQAIDLFPSEIQLREAAEVRLKANEAAAAAVRGSGGRTLHIDYEKLLTEPRKYVESLAAWGDRPYAQTAVDLVDPKLKHH